MPSPVRDEVLKLKPHKTGNLCVTEQWSMFVFPLLQWKSNKYYIFWVQGCSLRYTACKVLVPNHLWPAWMYNIFPQYLINGNIKRKIIEYKMWVWISFTTFVWNIFHSKKKWVGYDKKMYIHLHVQYLLFLSNFNKTWTVSMHFQKILKY